jgi:hypothetical protein
MRLGQGALGPDDALRDGRLADQERAGDLVRREAAQQAQRATRASVDSTG